MKKKRILDVIMVVLLLVLMGYQKTGCTIHEILGVVMLFCFILHHMWNRQWYRSVFRGKYSLLKKIYMIINFLLLMNVLLLVLSGISMAGILPFIQIMPASTARQWHLVLSYWSFILMALHLGLHMPALVKKNIKLRWKMICCGIVILGIVMFVKNRWLSYLMMLTQFAYYDENVTLIGMILENLLIFLLIVIVTYVVMKKIQHVSGR